ncbi:MAG: hypothetical protein Unbinned4336contig1001_29 [Prokaryotic dsDNA virus sp.]|nr:MAG: hypothetical protein Unbinned4336contig1001_29 [Prokaryotic dsDNA virus sp.]|tara:strand:- start:1265 stop:1576 length:312 start_codon:yes stop_codon:yes gene_type:complete
MGINPYLDKLTVKDFEVMNIKDEMLVVRALTPKDLGSLISLNEGVYDHRNARVHEVVKTGEKVKLPVGTRCLVLANTMDAVDDSGEFCFIEEQDVYAWWPKGK